MSSSSSLHASPLAEGDEIVSFSTPLSFVVASSSSSSSSMPVVLRDLLRASVHIFACLCMAMLASTYEDYDVTHTRPNPSTLRRYGTATAITSASATSSSSSSLRGAGVIDFLGAATGGMGWGQSNRDAVAIWDAEGAAGEEIDGDVVKDGGNYDVDVNYRSSSFADWYGDGAYSMRWMPSYNEIMLVHRAERVPRWRGDVGVAHQSPWTTSETSSTRTATERHEERLREAVSRLYRSIDDLDRLRGMADEYMWDEMRAYLDPRTSRVGSKTTTITTGGEEEGISLHIALEDSMDAIRTSPALHRTQSRRDRRDVANDLPDLIGFDWGSCAWRHCGARADAQEAMSELYNNVGMLEPFECRFIIGELLFFFLGEGVPCNITNRR